MVRWMKLEFLQSVDPEIDKASYDNQKTSSNFVTRGSVTGPRIVTSSSCYCYSRNIIHIQYKCSWKSFKLYNFEPAGWFAIATNGRVTGTPTTAGTFQFL